jgi:lysyl-tRNA synthetase class 2
MSEAAEHQMRWRSTASRAALQLRARTLATVRQFFAARNVLEVTTPVMVRAAVTDIHLASARIVLPGDESAARFLHTSPEYAMKRLLASGVGDIYQICQVVRGFERGRLHNCEFTLLEWYRIGWSLEQLIDEIHMLLETVFERRWAVERVTYQRAFEQALDIDPLEAPIGTLRQCASELGLADADAQHLSRDSLLDFLLTARIASELGQNKLSFVHRYPASQAALARLDPADPRVALRFELYLNGIELANGFDELGERALQEARFEADLRLRSEHRLPAVRIDERLLAALDAGLPPCCGVALGFDRLLMLVGGLEKIDAVLSFPDEIA